MARIKYYDPSDKTWKHADEPVHICPVQSVNGKTGTPVLTYQDTGSEPAGAVSTHNKSAEAHADLRALIGRLFEEKLNSAGITTKTAILTLKDGSTATADILVLSQEETGGYTNQVPLSIDTDGSIYNSTGYSTGLRLSSSGVLKAQAGSAVTGFIRANGGDLIRVYGCGWASTEHPNNYLCAYDSSFTLIGGYVPNVPTHYGTQVVAAVNRSDNGDAVITLENLSTISYIRVSSRGLTSTSSINGEDMIVTVNEEIL